MTMDVIQEQPIRLAVIAAAALLVTWLLSRQSRRRLMRISPILLAIAAAGLFVWERRVVTLREEIAAVLHAIADDIESNDLSRIVRHVSRSAPELQREAARYVPRYRFHRVSVKRNLQVQRQADDPDQGVTATFNAVFLVSEDAGDLRNLLSPWYFIVQFAREDDTWKVVGYERRDPREGL